MSSAGHNLQQIAKVLKSNGTDGELVMSFPYVDPEDIEIQEPVFIYFDGLPVPFFIKSITRRGGAKALVRLTDIETFDDAQEIVGQAVYVEENGDAEYADGDFSFLVGWKLYDDGTFVGEITDFIDIPSNPCIEVCRDNGSPAIIPLHDDLILSIDEEGDILNMSLPEGLLE